MGGGVSRVKFGRPRVFGICHDEMRRKKSDFFQNKKYPFLNLLYKVLGENDGALLPSWQLLRAAEAELTESDSDQALKKIISEIKGHSWLENNDELNDWQIDRLNKLYDQVLFLADSAPSGDRGCFSLSCVAKYTCVTVAIAGAVAASIALFGADGGSIPAAAVKGSSLAFAGHTGLASTAAAGHGATVVSGPAGAFVSHCPVYAAGL